MLGATMTPARLLCIDAGASWTDLNGLILRRYIRGIVDTRRFPKITILISIVPGWRGLD